MSTRANIVFEDGNEYLSIYSHFDGYPKTLGKTLLQDYNTEHDAYNLIMDGNCSYPGKPYGESYSIKHTLRQCYNEEHLYLWNNGWWYITEDLEKIPLEAMII